ncbi:MAG: pilus assembly protein N-terminal domain-containing protein [Acidobacteriota bacterium]
MRARIGIALLCFFVLSCVSSIGPALCAQTPASPPQSAGTATEDSANDLFVTVGQSVLVDTTQPITRVAVGLGDIAEATATSLTEVMVNGKAPGVTSLIIWEARGARQFFRVTVRPSSFVQNDSLQGVERELRLELPGQRLKVSSEGGLIFLRGTVKDLNSSQRAFTIASTAGKVVNLLYVDVPPSQPQILLRVRFASVDMSKVKQLGLNIFSVGAANLIGTVTTGQFSAPIVSAPSTGPATAFISDALNVALFSQGLGLGVTLKALQNDGVIQVLAEPNLLAADGKQASFLAGGQYPYPVVQGVTGGGTGAVTIQFKEFGVRLNFIPTITPRNTIRLQVAPEVSSLDFTDGIQISGFTVPALNVRKVNTEVEMAQGQSLAIGGLLDNRETQNLEKVPFIGDIPVLGKLFHSISKTTTNTELIVIVTPEIVAPIPAGVPLPELNYPNKFLPQNSKIPMMNPGPEVTGAKPLPPAPPKISIEDLKDSMKPEQPLVIPSETGFAGTGSTMPVAAASQ